MTYPCPFPMCNPEASCTFRFKLAGDRADGQDIGHFDQSWRLPDSYYSKQFPLKEVLSESGRSFFRRLRQHIDNKHGFKGSPWEPTSLDYDPKFGSLTGVSVLSLLRTFL